NLILGRQAAAGLAHGALSPLYPQSPPQPLWKTSIPPQSECSPFRDGAQPCSAAHHDQASLRSLSENSGAARRPLSVASGNVDEDVLRRLVAELPAATLSNLFSRPGGVVDVVASDLCFLWRQPRRQSTVYRGGHRTRVGVG